jgi:hypothetical protein
MDAFQENALDSLVEIGKILIYSLMERPISDVSINKKPYTLHYIVLLASNIYRGGSLIRGSFFSQSYIAEKNSDPGFTTLQASQAHAPH